MVWLITLQLSLCDILHLGIYRFFNLPLQCPSLWSVCFIVRWMLFCIPWCNPHTIWTFYRVSVHLLVFFCSTQFLMVQGVLFSRRAGGNIEANPRWRDKARIKNRWQRCAVCKNSRIMSWSGSWTLFPYVWRILLTKRY